MLQQRVPCLDDTAKAMLVFEREWANQRRDDGRYLSAIRVTFGLSHTRYAQLLNATIDTPAALAEDPITVNRLRRLRAKHQRSRVTKPV